MAIDHVKRQRTRDAAEELLRARYGEGRNYLDPIRVMQDVRAQAFGYFVREGEEAPEVPAEDLLAALTQVEEARARLDALERDLIRGARNRGASWQKIADSLGMANRQAAEARATRLERAAESHSRDRDVPTQRRERARQRAVEAWCAVHQARIRQTVQRLVDVAEAWPQLAEDFLTSHSLRALENRLNGDGDGVKLLDDLETLRTRLAPHGQPPLEPAGERAREAAQARDAAVALLSDLAAVRLEVDAARMSTVR
ncbi:hypothetical protein G3I20_18875 [Streptomyces sp. SID8111]|uniref:hypothetical protein n=1 Tax=Streptomyces sp. SID8111 TaxID=2706100 RepID=UPI0013BF337E|nr:hypothetical protein [Streptomyces sp. SID8111]NEB59706.1 hypothetical protein [Streptomyces diastaticus]NEC28580.1 hypothetical protein [Streptomyces sp. SID8111]